MIAELVFTPIRKFYPILRYSPATNSIISSATDSWRKYGKNLRECRRKKPIPQLSVPVNFIPCLQIQHQLRVLFLVNPVHRKFHRPVENFALGFLDAIDHFFVEQMLHIFVFPCFGQKLMPHIFIRHRPIQLGLRPPVIGNKINPPPVKFVIPIRLKFFLNDFHLISAAISNTPRIKRRLLVIHCQLKTFFSRYFIPISSLILSARIILTSD